MRQRKGKAERLLDFRRVGQPAAVTDVQRAVIDDEVHESREKEPELRKQASVQRSEGFRASNCSFSLIVPRGTTRA